MKEYIINVEGMACAGCERRVINVLSQLPGVKEVVADHTTGKVTIKAEAIDESLVKEKISNLGFKVV